MTQDEIIEMARRAGAMFDHMTWVERDLLPVFERFAKLVEEKEREKCALLCEEERINATHYSAPTQSNWLAKKIRAQ